jgi:hypothetical protein
MREMLFDHQKRDGGKASRAATKKLRDFATT